MFMTVNTLNQVIRHYYQFITKHHSAYTDYANGVQKFHFYDKSQISWTHTDGCSQNTYAAETWLIYTAFFKDKKLSYRLETGRQQRISL